MIARLAKRIRTSRIGTALLLSAALCDTSNAAIKHTPKSIPELQAAIEAVLRETKTPGAAIAIVSRDEVQWIAGLGKADVAANKPVTTETLFRIGSVSKSFAALAALKLQEEGKLKLTDTVRRWAPEVAFVNPWEATDPVRLVHLMEHTAGFDDIHLREYALNDPTPLALKDALAFGAPSRVSRWRPGTRMAYCNSGPAVLAAVIEKVSGKRFEDYVQEHFFDPLHMDTASYFYTPEVQRQLTKLYHADGSTPYPYWHIIYPSSGSINASVKDMANYVRWYLQRGSLDGTQLLGPSSIGRMETTETLPSAKLGNVAGYGLYNMATLEGPFVFRGHTGGMEGALTEVAYLPDYGRGYVVMINSGKGTALRDIGKLLRHYVTRDLTPPALPPAAPVSAGVQKHYSGYYQVTSPRTQWFYPFERLLRIQKLTFTADGLSTGTYGLRKERYVPISERLFRKQDQSVAMLALLPDAEGEILIQSDFRTFKKVSAWRVWSQRIAMGLTLLLMLSSPALLLGWRPRKLFGKLHDAGPLLVRFLPWLSTTLLTAFFGLLAIGIVPVLLGNGVGNVMTLGVRSVLTVAIMLSSIGFALATTATLYVLYRARNAPMNRLVYWHSASVAVAMGGVAAYLGYWGLIGLRLWA